VAVLAGVVAVLGLAVVGAVGRAVFDLQRQAGDILTGPSGSMLAIPDLASLARQADLVVVGRVSAAGVTRMLVQPAQTPIPFQPPPGSTPPPTRVLPPEASRGGTLSIPSTRYPVQVERVVRGSGVAPAPQITVVQPGGVISAPVVPGGPALTRTVQIEDDTLMNANERYVLFLQRTDDGSYVVVGGPQGRLPIDAQGRVHPLHPGIPATRGHDGQALDSFISEVAAIR
jgi:hypothetical protein